MTHPPPPQKKKKRGNKGTRFRVGFLFECWNRIRNLRRLPLGPTAIIYQRCLDFCCKYEGRHILMDGYLSSSGWFVDVAMEFLVFNDSKHHTPEQHHPDSNYSNDRNTWASISWIVTRTRNTYCWLNIHLAKKSPLWSLLCRKSRQHTKRPKISLTGIYHCVQLI